MARRLADLIWQPKISTLNHDIDFYHKANKKYIKKVTRLLKLKTHWS